MMRYRRCIWNTIWINTIREKCRWSSNKHESHKINVSAAWEQEKDKAMPFTLLQPLAWWHITLHEAMDTEKCSLNDFWGGGGNPRDCNITKTTEELEGHSYINRWKLLTKSLFVNQLLQVQWKQCVSFLLHCSLNLETDILMSLKIGREPSTYRMSKGSGRQTLGIQPLPKQTQRFQMSYVLVMWIKLSMFLSVYLCAQGTKVEHDIRHQCLSSSPRCGWYK